MTKQWLTVDEGWGRAAVDFATLLEPGACREYVSLHEALGVRSGDHLLDVACGSGLALELARIRGATVSGIDASVRLVEVARDRLAEADLVVGDMADLPWPDGTFDVVTSFRGLWATTREALAEARRVLRPGGRIGLTTWGHVKASPGFWALSPFALAADDRVRAQADMKALGRPGVGEEILSEAGFVGVRRHSVPFVWEFASPEMYATVLAATGPAHEAIQAVGEEEFRRYCLEVATGRVRDGLPLRAEIDCVGLTASVPRESGGPLLGDAPTSEAAAALAEEDLADLGFVTNATTLWMHDPDLVEELFELMSSSARGADLSLVDRGVATIAAAGASGDPYCPLAWGGRVAEEAGAVLAGSLVSGSDSMLDARGRAIAAWARCVATDPHSTTPDHVETLVAAGLDNAQILRLTLFIALRVAFSSVNGALGAVPEQAYLDLVPPEVREAWEARFGL